MKKALIIAACVMVPSFAFAQTPAPAQQARVVEKTNSVSGNVSTHDGCNDFYLYVSRNTNQDGSLHGYLSYSEYDSCNGTQKASGNGEVPVASVTGDGKTGLKFKLNVATVRNFAVNGTPLKANLTWKAVPGDFYNGKSSGNSQTGTVRSKYTGTYGWQTAVTTGTMNLGDLDSVNGSSVSWSKNKYVTVNAQAQRSLAPTVQ